MAKALIGFGLTVLIAIAAAFVYAPYLPQVLQEGYPRLMWSGGGAHAAVEGAATLLPLAPEPRLADPGPDLMALLERSQGKALLVARGGHLELEYYARDVTAETALNSFSMAKGLVAALVYKALAEKRIDSLDQTLSEFLPAYRGVASVSLSALLSMHSGIHFNEGGAFGDSMGKDSETAPNPFGQLARLHFAGLDAVAPALTAEVQPVATYTYRNINTALLGRVLETIYRRPLPALLSEKLWQPAGAGTAKWRKPGALLPVSAYCCIYATARDWLRVGIYLLHNGTAEAPYLPESLWREYLGLDVEIAARRAGHYGMHVWQNVLDRPGEPLSGPFTYLMGQGGQVLYLLPEQDLVVYRAGEREQLLHSTLYASWRQITAP